MLITAICADKTLGSLNILNPNKHAHAAQPIREKGTNAGRGLVVQHEYILLNLNIKTS